MPASLKHRFNGNSQEVIEYTRIWGRFKAMDKFGVHDTIAFDNFLREMGCDENFGYLPALSSENGSVTAENLVDAFSNRLLKNQARIVELEGQIDRLKAELEYRKHQDALEIEPKIKDLLNLCDAK